MELSDIQLDPLEQGQVKRMDTGRGCKKCTEKQLIANFNDLQAGEHIEMRGSSQFCNRALYSHHAIVDCVRSSSNDGQQAKVSLLGVKNQQGEVGQEDRELDLDKDKIRLVEYNKRKFDLPQTKERAASKNGTTVPYRFFSRNCETFTTICVVGNDFIDENLSDSTTKQGRDFFMGVVNCVCLGSRFAASLLTFFLYITFVAGDNIIDIVPKSSAALFSMYCRVNASSTTGAKRHRICHLQIQAIFILVYLLYVLFHIVFTIRAKFTCRRCKVKSILVVVSRFFLYCVFEILLIFLEPFVFTKIKKWITEIIKGRKHLKRFLLVVIAFVKSAIECTLIYWLSNCIVSIIPKYLVNKISIDEAGGLHKGDVISWRRGKCRCPVDAIIVEVHTVDDSEDIELDIIYEEPCSCRLFCTKVVKETNLLCDQESIKVYDFSDFSHKYLPEEVVSNAENQVGNGGVCYGVFCFNRSSSFCYSAKVKDISCPERFNCCERGCRSVCCY